MYKIRLNRLVYQIRQFRELCEDIILMNKDRIKIILVMVVAFTLTSTILIDTTVTRIANFETNSPIDNIFTTSAITLDGNLTAGEWDEAEYAISWYMNADPENYDGYNYMYIAEDPDNLYIALDLVSDQTDDPKEEWLGLWLNTNEAINNETDWYNETAKWEATLNSGMESLLYDVDNDREMPYFDPDGMMAGFATDFQSLDELIPINGSFTGTLDDVGGWFDSKSANMTSEYNGTHHVYRLDIEINITEYYTFFKELYANHTVWVEFKVNTWNNVTLDRHYLTIRDDLGTIELDNPNKTLEINTGTTWDEHVIHVTPGNFTEDKRVLLSLIGINDAPFNTSYDRLQLTIMSNHTNTGGMYYMVPYPYTTINSYEIDWAFWSSENNATPHRTFEIKIPKSELEGYETDTDLGIMVGGYGTLSSWPNTHNWVLANGTDTGIPFMETDAYYYYSMPMKVLPPTTATTTTSITTSETSTTTTTSTGTTSITTTSTTVPTSSTSTTTNGTTTPTPTPVDMTMVIVILGAGIAGIVVIVVIMKLRKS